MAEKKLTKICRKCQIKKLITEFALDRSIKSGVRSQCKDCQKQYRIENKIKIVRYRKEHVEIRILYDKQYHLKNKKKHAAWQRQYNIDNKDKIALLRKKYYQDNKEWFFEYRKQYQKDNKGLIRAKRQKNKKAISEYGKQYRQTEQGKIVAKRARNKRRALKAGVMHESFNPKEILERDGYICQLCGEKTVPDCKNQYNPLYPNLDHIVPISKGGAHTRLNTQCLCRQCNYRKHNSGNEDQKRLLLQRATLCR